MASKPATIRKPKPSRKAAKPVRVASPRGSSAAEQAEVKALLEKIHRTLDETEAILASVN